MTPAERQKIEACEQLVSGAVRLIRIELPAIEAFLAREGKGSDDRASAAILKPIFEAARNLVRVHDEQLKVAHMALAAVKETA